MLGLGVGKGVALRGSSELEVDLLSSRVVSLLSSRVGEGTTAPFFEL